MGWTEKTKEADKNSVKAKMYGAVFEEVIKPSPVVFLL
jgi:hypothetical protein